MRSRHRGLLGARDDVAGVIAREEGPQVSSGRALHDIPIPWEQGLQFLFVHRFAMHNPRPVKNREGVSLSRTWTMFRERRVRSQRSIVLRIIDFQPFQAFDGGRFGMVLRADAHEAAARFLTGQDRDRLRPERHVGGFSLPDSWQRRPARPQAGRVRRGPGNGAPEDIPRVGSKLATSAEAGLQEKRILSVHGQILAAGDYLAECRVVESLMIDVLAGVGLVDPGCRRASEADVQP